MARPILGTYPPYFENYIRLTDFETPAQGVEQYSKMVMQFFTGIPEEKSDYKYAEGKWSLKELLLHITDTERIFAYRALALSRGETTALPGFDENAYVVKSGAEHRTWQDVLQEFKAVRLSTDLLLLSFSPEQLQRQGVTNNNPTSVNAIVYITFGHLLHHINVVKERYL